MLCMVVGVGSASAQSATADVTYDFTGSDWEVSNGALTNGTVSFSGTGSANFQMNTGYFILGKSGAYINFPKYDKEVEKIVVTGRSGASGSVKQNIFVGETAVSTETTGATGANTYEIASANQAVGTQYTLKVTSSHNTQITKIEVFFKVSAPASPLASIALSGSYPTSFKQGAEFSHEGMTVTATYEDNTTKDVTTSATFSGYDMSQTGSQEVTVSYVEGEVTKTATYNITVNEAPALSSIAITAAPTKTAYSEGDTFDATGMVVTATYADETTADVTADCTFNPSTNLALTDTEVTVSYTENGVTKTATQPITVAEVVDYVALPYTWEGGTKSELNAVVGVTTSGLGTDYAESNAPYRVKFDNTGDYIQFKTNGQPGKVTVNVKMIGGASDSSIKVQGSSDGTTFNDIETLLISGSQNTELTLESTKSFAATDRFVRLSFTKGSNVGVGGIAIALPAADAKLNPGLSYENDNYTAYIGSEFVAPELINPNSLSVTYSSDNSSIADVDANSGVVTIGTTEGSATITASFAGNDTYESGSASYTINVADPTWIDLTAQGYENGDEVTEVVGANGILTFDTGTGSTSPKWYDSGSAVRIYANNTITVTAKAGYAIESVEFSVTSGSMGNDKGTSNPEGTWSNNKFTPNSLATTFVYTTNSTYRIDKIKINVVQAVPVTITSAGAASFSSTEALDFTNVTGITAYAATMWTDNYVHLDPVTTIPSGEGIIVKGAQGTYNVPVATGEVTLDCSEENLLKGTATEAKVISTDEAATERFYKYVKTESGKVGFQKVLSTASEEKRTCAKGHAYLELTTEQQARFIGFADEEGGIATGINAIDNGQLTIDNDAPAYNLAGQKVGKGYKGIVVKNGKKYVK